MSVIENGLRADIMRKRMEDKNSLVNKNSFYVGEESEQGIITGEIHPSVWDTAIFIKDGMPSFETIYNKNFQYSVTNAEYTNSIESVNNNFTEIQYQKVTSHYSFITLSNTTTYLYEIKCSVGDIIQFNILGTCGEKNVPMNIHKMFMVPMTSLYGWDIDANKSYNINIEGTPTSPTNPSINISVQFNDDKKTGIITISVSATSMTLQQNQNFNINSFKYRILK